VENIRENLCEFRAKQDPRGSAVFFLLRFPHFLRRAKTASHLAVFVTPGIEHDIISSVDDSLRCDAAPRTSSIPSCPSPGDF
jgi:hypothetical protein